MTIDPLALKDSGDVVLDGRSTCVVDDDELYRAHVGLLLAQKNLVVIEASDTNALQTILDRRMPDCILLDYNLVSENGLFVVERLKQRYPTLAPIVMVSADDTQRTTLRAFRAGVTDYVVKRGLTIEELTGAVRRAIGLRVRDEARDHELERLRRNAAFDEHTGLLTRTALEERLALVDETAHRLRRSYGLVALRVALIDEARDRFGVVAADRILRAFGQKLRDLVRSTDLCGVWERGTFLYVVDAISSPLSFAAVEKRLVGQAKVEIDLASAHLSLGVVSAAAFHPDDGATPVALLAALEARLATQVQAFDGTAAGAADWVRLADRPTGAATTEPTERRREPRQRTLKQGRIYLNGLQSTIDCTVRNLSTGGAGLRLSGPTAIPEFFRLRVSDNGVVRKVRKCWHLNNDLGVEFLSD